VRSLAEIRFRLRQEFGNLLLLAMPGRGPGSAGPPACKLPVMAAGVAEIEALAESILAHRFPMLGLVIETGPTIDWRRDYVHGISSGTPYFRRSPYLDFARVGDHKLIWELNRHQYLVLLAQAFLLTGRREFLDEVFRQLEDWMGQNPFLRGINWASALEVAFRALSWCWLYQLVGDQLPAPLRGRFLTELYRHGRYLELNLSVYFSPNTHLLGEAVALHALAVLFPGWPRAARWAQTAGRIVEEQLERQVRADGSHFEQSAYYHVYALDFFLLHYQLAGQPEKQRAMLLRMAEYLAALMGPSGILPLIGDDDGGRLFHPYGDRTKFGRATLQTCAGVLGQVDSTGSRLFSDAGVAVMTGGDAHIVIKAGPFGEGSGGHSHSDVLSLVARLGDREILIDPGTYTYVADPKERNRFRGSAAHNTVRIDGRDQALPAGPFRWNQKPTVTISQWTSGARRDFLDATCTYGGLTHRRRVLLVKPDLVMVLDTVEGGPGEHLVEQFWHLAGDEGASRLSFSEPAEGTGGWRSRAFAAKEPSPVLCVKRRGPLPVAMAAVLDLSASPRSGPVEVLDAGEAFRVTWCGERVELQ
jgi:hypothetical protein